MSWNGKTHAPRSAKGTPDGRTKAFVKVCYTKVLRRSVVVCCGAKAELEKLFFDPRTFDGFAPSPKEHRETWAHVAKGWDEAGDAFGFTTWFRGDVFVVLPEWDSRTFVHEAYHAAQAVLRIVGTQDEELGAFIVEWLFEEICRDGRPGRKKGRSR